MKLERLGRGEFLRTSCQGARWDPGWPGEPSLGNWIGVGRQKRLACQRKRMIMSLKATREVGERLLQYRDRLTALGSCFAFRPVLTLEIHERELTM